MVHVWVGMTNAPFSHENRADVASDVAAMLRVASRHYSQFWAALAHAPVDKRDARETCELIRRGATRLAEGLAYATALATPSAGLGVPRPVLDLLRDLLCNYTLLSTLKDYEEIFGLPLVPWPKIEAELQKPECQEWMKTALAAYRPLADGQVEAR